MKPTVSVVILSYTTERFNDLTELIDSIQVQTYPGLETIVVTERSTELYDKLKAYVEEKGYTNTRVLFNTGPLGVSPARNLGAKQARGEIIAFIDDDALPSPDWLGAISETFTDDSIIGVTGPIIPLWQGESMDWFPEEFHWILGCNTWIGLNEMKEVRNAWGANMSFRKEAFDSGIFFIDSFGGRETKEKGKGKVELFSDDTEFSLRARRETGKHIIYNPQVKIWHKVYGSRLTPKFVRHFAYWHAYTKALIKRLYGNSKNNENVLAVEYKLLRRILLRLLPSILIGFFKDPVRARRRLSVTVRVLFYTTLGYLTATFRREKAVTDLVT